MGGTLLDDELEEVKMIFPLEIEFAVETGTYKGQSAKQLAKHFKKVHTIEIFEPLFRESKNNNKDVNNIIYHFGDTIELLPNIVKSIDKPAFYFIDAHISGQDTMWNKIDRCPLLRELEIVLRNSKCKQMVIAFDDIRLFESKESWYREWAGISKESINKKIEEFGFSIVNSYERDDRYYVYLV